MSDPKHFIPDAIALSSKITPQALGCMEATQAFLVDLFNASGKLPAIAILPPAPGAKADAVVAELPSDSQERGSLVNMLARRCPVGFAVGIEAWLSQSTDTCPSEAPDRFEAIMAIVYLRPAKGADCQAWATIARIARDAEGSPTLGAWEPPYRLIAGGMAPVNACPEQN